MRGGGLKRVSSRVRGARHELDGPPHQHLVLSKQKTEGGQRGGTSEEVRGAKEGSGLESGVAHLRYLVPCSANSGAQHAARPKSRAAAAHLELLNHRVENRLPRLLLVHLFLLGVGAGHVNFHYM